MTDLLCSLLPVLEVLGLIALTGFNLLAYFMVVPRLPVLVMFAYVDQTAGPGSRRWFFELVLGGMVVSLGLQVASLWYFLFVGKLGLALILGGLVLPAVPLTPLVANLCLLPFHLVKGLVVLVKKVAGLCFRPR